MLLGPVFHAELITTARRMRYYALRFLYGLMILVQMGTVFQSWDRSWRWRSTQPSLSDMAEFANTIFVSFAILQGLVILFLTPALVAGTVADERQRKTLHYLLTSQLTGGEIVLGKLAARLLQLGVYLLMGLPILSLLSLFGGVDPRQIILTYAGTGSSMFFLAALSILVSVRSRTAREAVVAAYLFALVWLFLPYLFLTLLPLGQPEWWERVEWWLEPPLQWMLVCSPMSLALNAPGTNTTTLPTQALWMIGTQVGYGTVLAVVAAWQLRPAYRALEDQGGRGRFRWVRAIVARRSWLPRPACGDDAMLWKERYVSRTTGLAKLGTLILGITLYGLFAWSAYDYVKPVVHDLFLHGWGDVNSSARSDLHGFLIVVSIITYLIWLLAISTAAAGSVTSEKEGDTWLSLTATPMEGREIVLSKMVGAAWSGRLLLSLLVIFWTTGLVLGAIHPFGVMLAVFVLAVFSWFTVALGVSISLRSKNSTRSLGLTMLILLVINGGYLFCCMPFSPDSPVVVVGCTPAVVAGSILDYETVGQLLRGQSTGLGRRTPEFIATGVLSILFYLAAALALTATAVGGFDEAVDRPDRFRRALPRGATIRAKPVGKPPSARMLE